jgi:hypothetical protein
MAYGIAFSAAFLARCRIVDFFGFTGKHSPEVSSWGNLVKAKMTNQEKAGENGDKRNDQGSWIGLLAAWNLVYG